MRSLLFLCALFFTISLTAVPQYSWSTGSWSACSDVCDGTQTRVVQCHDNIGGGGVVDDSFCTYTAKPATEQPCGVPCTYSWVAGEWGGCSEICGPGTQTRSVQCTKVETSEVVSEVYCDSTSMPALTQTCNDGPCIDEDTVDEDTIDEDAADEDLIDEDLFEGEADEDTMDIDAIFVDEDTADNETVIDETVEPDEAVVNDDQTGDEDQTADEIQTTDNSSPADDDSAYGSDFETDEDDISVVDQAGSNDSGCGCDVIGL